MVMSMVSMYRAIVESDSKTRVLMGSGSRNSTRFGCSKLKQLYVCVMLLAFQKLELDDAAFLQSDEHRLSNVGGRRQ